MRYKQVGQCVLTVKSTRHCGFPYTHQFAIRHCNSRSHADLLCRQTPFTKEIRRIQNSDSSFFARLGNDGKFYLPFLDIKDRVACIALRVYSLLCSNAHDPPAVPDRSEECIYVEFHIFGWYG